MERASSSSKSARGQLPAALLALPWTSPIVALLATMALAGSSIAQTDYGDLPASFGDASHEITSLFLGKVVDGESGSQYSSGATGDDLNGLDDEDGVLAVSNWSDGTGDLQVEVTGGNGCLNAWLDFTDGATIGPDGGFGDTYPPNFSEHVVKNKEVTPGVTTLSFPLPSGAADNGVNWGLRVRLTPRDSGGDCNQAEAFGGTASPVGHVVGGEVEDYLLDFGPTGDAPPCGDGNVDDEEQCDDGFTLNGTMDSCCAQNCTFKDAGEACTDVGLFCTGPEECDGSGNCVSTGNPCPGHNVAPDCDDSCNEAMGNCTAPDDASTACEDGFSCTENDECDGAGVCQGNPVHTDCGEDSDPCTEAVCDPGSGDADPATGCVNTFSDIDGDGVCDGVEEGCLPASSMDATRTALPAAAGPGCVILETDCTHTDVAVFTEQDLGGDPGFVYPFGLVGFTLNDCPETPGQALANVKLTFTGATDLSRMTFRKHGPLVPGVPPLVFYTLAEENVNSNVEIMGNMITFELQGGETGDDTADPTIIVDQGGPGVPGVVPAPALTPLAMAAATLLLLAISGLTIRRLWGAEERR